MIKIGFLSFIMFMSSIFFKASSDIAISIEGAKQTINVRDSKRPNAYIYTPNNYRPNHKLPLVILLHGTPGSAALQNLYFHLSFFVNKRQFILLTPEGTTNSNKQQFWNATDACCDLDHSNVDDEGYLMALLKEVQKKYSIDESMIYVFGHSNGAVMAHRLACHQGATFAAIASLAGTTYQDQAKCNPQLSISVLEIHAENDSSVYWDGGISYGARYPGTPETVNRWVTSNNCKRPLPESDSIDLLFSIPGTDTTKTKWTDCDNKTEVELWTIESFRFAYAHAPIIKNVFVDDVLDFLFAHKKIK